MTNLRTDPELKEKLSTIRFVSNAGSFQDSALQTGTVKECFEWCNKQDVLAVDTETTGLDFLTKKVIMLQIGNKERQYVIDTRGIDISILSSLFSSKKILKLYHNFKFDGPMLTSSFGFTHENVYDTMIVEQVLHAGKQAFRYSLADLCQRYLGVELDKSTRNQFINLRGRPFTFKQILYGADDVRYLIAIRKEQKAEYKGEKFEETIHLENKAVLAFADIQYNGITVDVPRWKELAKNTEKELIDLEKELDNLILADSVLGVLFKSDYIQADLFKAEEDLRKVNVKWSSNKEVLKVMKKINPEIESCGAPVLFKHKKEHPLIAKFGEYQKARKKVTSYGFAFLDYLRKDGKVHTRFNQVLSTGRVSSSDPNMQQIPGTNTYRNCFETGDPDWVFVSSDYSSQELCFIAEKSKDPVWIAALDNGEDLHSVCADLVFKDKWKKAAEEDCAYMKHKQKCNCKEHKKLRTSVKSINFG